MKFQENVDNEPKNRRFHFGYVLHSGGTLTFELPDLGEGALIINGFDFWGTYYVL